MDMYTFLKGSRIMSKFIELFGNSAFTALIGALFGGTISVIGQLITSRCSNNHVEKMYNLKRMNHKKELNFKYKKQSYIMFLKWANQMTSILQKRKLAAITGKLISDDTDICVEDIFAELQLYASDRIYSLCWDFFNSSFENKSATNDILIKISKEMKLDLEI